MALEAMAQAACVLAGTPARDAVSVSMAAPVMLPVGLRDCVTVIRTSAIRDAGAITVTLRADTSNFTVEHGRATFSCDAEASRSGDQNVNLRRQPGGADDRSGAQGAAVSPAELYG